MGYVGGTQATSDLGMKLMSPIEDATVKIKITCTEVTRTFFYSALQQYDEES